MKFTNEQLIEAFKSLTSGDPRKDAEENTAVGKQILAVNRGVPSFQLFLATLQPIDVFTEGVQLGTILSEIQTTPASASSIPSGFDVVCPDCQGAIGDLITVAKDLVAFSIQNNISSPIVDLARGALEQILPHWKD